MNAIMPVAVFPDRVHDHGRCLDEALARAETVCAGRAVRLTALRRRVLELIWRSHRPVGAYEVLDALRRERPGAAPPTVYRVLEFLVGEGLVHRIERRNAYIGCRRPGHDHPVQLLMCTGCGQAAELEDDTVDAAVRAAAAAVGFAVAGPATVEAEGLCPHCRGAAS